MRLIQLKCIDESDILNVTTSAFPLALFLKVSHKNLKSSIMKKLILITSCVALFAATSFAQDTTKTRSRQSQSQQEPQQKQQSNQMRNEDMKGWTKVQTTDVPSSLRTTLNGSQYSGWESGTIYRNEAGDTYQLRTSGNNPKTYYFDRNGKPTTKPNKTNPH
jgi:hypothetical protein